MKKALLTLVVLVFGCVVIAGCGVSKTAKVEDPYMAHELKNAPKWVLGSEMEGGFSAVGSAKIGEAGIQFARTEALAHGRNELARQFGVKVKDFVKNFMGVTGIGDRETVDRASVQVSKQVASQMLNGSRQNDTWISPSGELYVLVVIEPSKAINSVKNSVRSSFKNNEALWQQFQAKKAHEELDKEIEKEFGDYKNQ